ncbi:MAG: DUF2249 domain-containing protein [Roseovarius sp.]|nr:DUF2249 domain-containing protein [Roseovarius sp.]
MAEDEMLPGRWSEGADGPELDLRGLEPPEPMVGILGRIEADPHHAPFTVRLARDPIHLFAELIERGWAWQYLPAEADEVRLRLERPA